MNSSNYLVKKKKFLIFLFLMSRVCAFLGDKIEQQNVSQNGQNVLIWSWNFAPIKAKFIRVKF